MFKTNRLIFQNGGETPKETQDPQPEKTPPAATELAQQLLNPDPPKTPTEPAAKPKEWDPRIGLGPSNNLHSNLGFDSKYKSADEMREAYTKTILDRIDKISKFLNEQNTRLSTTIDDNTALATDVKLSKEIKNRNESLLSLLTILRAELAKPKAQMPTETVIFIDSMTQHMTKVINGLEEYVNEPKTSTKPANPQPTEEDRLAF